MNSKIIELPVIVLVGPTAVGKTELSLNIAKHFGCEIVGLDSMQVYRYMDIGTAKASVAERMEVPHHLIDIVDPDEHYDSSLYVRDAEKAISDVHMKGKIPLLTGGTGLYLRSLLRGVFDGTPADPQIRETLKMRLKEEGCYKLHQELSVIDCKSAERINCHDSQRLLRALEIYYSSGIPWSKHLENHQSQRAPQKFQKLTILGLSCPREELYERINLRTRKMIEAGLEKEVKNLLEMGFDNNTKSLCAIGYRHMMQYLEHLLSFEEMIESLARDTRRYAKRQFTWFSKTENLIWFEASEPASVLRYLEGWIMKQ